VLAALLFGTIPAIQASRPDLHDSLNDRGVHTADRRRRGLRSVLVASEVALAMVLLVGAGLMFRSLRSLERVDLGFRPDSVLTFHVTLPVDRYGDVSDRAKFQRRLEAAARRLDHVSAVGATSVLPLGGEFWTSPYQLSGPVTSDALGREANYQFVTHGMFEALGIELVVGRLISESDEQERRDVIVVDRTFAAAAWPGESPIGRKVHAEDLLGGSARWFQVVGVVEHVHLDDPRELSRETIFFPWTTQGAFPSMTVLVRTTGAAPEELAAPLRDVVHDLDAELPLGAVRPLPVYVDDTSAPTRFATLLIGLFALVALALAAIGVYGVVSSMVHQRTREIGLYLALGAPHPRIVRSVVGRGLRLCLAGLAAGLVVSLALARLTASLVAGISPTDPLTYVAVGTLLLAVTALASLVPARRAIHVNPMDALRYE